MALSAKDDGNWKQKYLDYKDQTELKEQQWRQNEALLRHSLSRVALAANGIDNDLDRQIKKLRKLLRDEGDYGALKQLVSSISNTVKNLDQPNHIRNSAEHILCCLIDNVELPNEFQRSANQLKQRLSTLASGDSSEPVVASYASILNDVLLALRGDSRSWLQRIFSDKNDISIDYSGVQSSLDNDEISDVVYGSVSNDVFNQLVSKFSPEYLDKSQSSELLAQAASLESKQTLSALLDELVQALQQTIKNSSNVPLHASTMANSNDNPRLLFVSQFCLKLLETLNFPQDLQAPATALRDRVVDGLVEAEIPGILKAISDLVITIRTRIESEKKNLQDNLVQLSDNLDDIDSTLTDVVNISTESNHSNKKFTQKTSQVLDKLSKSVEHTDNLALLKQAVQDSVHTIHSHIDINKNSQQEQQHILERALNKSSARLKKLQQQGDNLHKQLQKEHAQITHDALTGLHNRLAYEAHIQVEFARWKRYQKPLSILIIDIDHFKTINGNNGHKAGDIVLRLIARKLQSNIRETDFIARFGGEEFIIVMPETAIEEAMLLAEKLRQCIVDITFNHQDKTIPITISCGGTELIAGDCIDTAFERADQGLYQAKKLGRNQCYTGQAVA